MLNDQKGRKLASEGARWGGLGVGVLTFFAWREGYAQPLIDAGAIVTFLLLATRGALVVWEGQRPAEGEGPTPLAGALVEKPSFALPRLRKLGSEEAHLLLIILGFAALAAWRFDAPEPLKMTLGGLAVLLAVAARVVSGHRRMQAPAQPMAPPRPPKDWWKSLE